MNTYARKVPWTVYYKDHFRFSLDDYPIPPEGTHEGKISFRVLPDNSIAGSGEGRVADDEHYQNVVPKKKGDCLDHYLYQQTSFKLAGGRYDPLEKKVYFQIPMVSVTFQEQCLNKDGKITPSKPQSKEIKVLPWLALKCPVDTCGYMAIRFDLQNRKYYFNSASGEIPFSYGQPHFPKVSSTNNPYSSGTYSTFKVSGRQ